MCALIFQKKEIAIVTKTAMVEASINILTTDNPFIPMRVYTVKP
jgi:hypothetical protein